MNQFNDIDIGIERYIGKPGDLLEDRTLTGDISPQFQVLVYNSIKQLYYSNYISSSNEDISPATTASFNIDGTITGEVRQNSYNNFEQTTLKPHKYFPTDLEDEIGVISIPSKLFGEYIQPKSLTIYNELSGSLYDDGEGRIFAYDNLGEKNYIGNIIYSHGIIILTKNIHNNPYFENTRFIDTYIKSPNISLNFASSISLYETQYKITISPDEFNYSLNPTLIEDLEGNVKSFVNDDYFNPFITTIGLYNENNELMAVGKLAKPLPCSRNTDTTILINIDKI